MRVFILRLAVTLYRHSQRLHPVKGIHGVDHVVCHHLAAVHDADHERPTPTDRGVGDVGAPYLVAVVDLQPGNSN